MPKSTIFNQFFYDFKRALTSKSIIIITVIIILLGGSIISFLNPPAIASSTSFSYAVYVKDSNYEVMVFVYNMYGDPLPNIQVKLNVLNLNSSNTATPSSIYSVTDQTNNNGIAFFEVPKDKAVGFLSLDVSSGSSTINVISGLAYPWSDLIKVINYTGSFVLNPIAKVISASNSSRLDVLLFYVGKNGTLPLNYAVYVRQINIGNSNTSGFVELGTLNNYYQIFKLDKFRGPVDVELRDPNNNTVGSVSFNTEIQSSQPDPTNIAYSFISGIMVLLIPLMVILSAYNLYGKDKINNVLDFIYSLPITKLILNLSRYFSIVIMTMIAILLSLGVSDLLLYLKLGSTFAASLWISSLVGFLVPVIAILSIMFILSNLLKSTGSLLAISIVIWLIFGIFWNAIITILSFGLGVGIFTKDYFNLVIHSYFFNPLEFFSLVNMYTSNGIIISQIGIPANPADYGITLPNLFIAGLGWTLIPFLLYLYLLRKVE
ncbi:MAG TPA: ABC transporter permease subunit [Geobacterales bacterium]|nr:ABC transporter permease subunit [Geobacterales bacterium]